MLRCPRGRRGWSASELLRSRRERQVDEAEERAVWRFAGDMARDARGSDGDSDDFYLGDLAADP